MITRRRRHMPFFLMAAGLMLGLAVGFGPNAGSQAWAQRTITPDDPGPAPAVPASGFSMGRMFGGAAPEATSPTTPGIETVVGPIMTVDSGPLPQREMDETQEVLSLMPSVVQSIIFGSRKFEYDAKGRSDPMIVPWVLVEILSTEHIAQAKAYLKEADELTSPGARKKRYMDAIAECDEVLKLNAESKYGKDAAELKGQITALLDQLENPVGPITPRIILPSKAKFPQWVVINTKAVIYDQTGRGNHVVLVGDSMLSVGDKVPKYEDVRVVEISRNWVKYEYKYDPNEKPEEVTVNVTDELMDR